MKTYDLFDKLAALTLEDTQEEWDNSGALLSFDREVKKVLVTLDVNDDVVNEAIKIGAEMIVSHHPLIFDPLKSLNEKNSYHRPILKLIENKISVYSAHTNFDKMDGGNNDFLGNLFEVEQIIKPSSDNQFLRQGKLINPMSLEEYAHKICENLNINPSAIRMVKAPGTQLIQNIAWCSGDGMDFMFEAAKYGIDCYITGDARYHMANYASELGISLIDLGHFGSEYPFIDNMAAILNNIPNRDFEVIKTAEMKDPFIYLK